MSIRAKIKEIVENIDKFRIEFNIDGDNPWIIRFKRSYITVYYPNGRIELHTSGGKIDLSENETDLIKEKSYIRIDRILVKRRKEIKKKKLKEKREKSQEQENLLNSITFK